VLIKKYLCSNQCVNSCGNDYYEMGKYCLSDCTGGNRKEVDPSIKKCECRYLYYITSDNEYICYNQINIAKISINLMIMIQDYAKQKIHAIKKNMNFIE
jgi:hypothetical protein